jgi:hypothetical protein
MIENLYKMAATIGQNFNIGPCENWRKEVFFSDTRIDE